MNWGDALIASHSSLSLSANLQDQLVSNKVTDKSICVAMAGVPVDTTIMDLGNEVLTYYGIDLCMELM
jgi:hypothetical protein